jgi:zinc transport system substrate-binding protein
MKTVWFARFLSLAIVPLVGCQPGVRDPAGEAADGSGQKMLVAVSVLPQAWLVEQIGSPHVEAVALVKPGDSCEVYQPSDAQVSRIMRAKVFFSIGMPFENGPGVQAIRSQGRLRVVDTRRGIQLRCMDPHHHAGEAHGHGAGEGGHGHSHGAEEAHGDDPHVWLSPRLLAVQAQTVAETLCELDPAHQADYRRNLESLQGRLAEIHKRLQETLAPLEGKAFFVVHPAWGYFADEYGLRQVAVESEGKEPSDRELTRLHQEARAHGAKVIFAQPQSSRQAAEALARAIGGRVETLDPLVPDVAENLLRAGRLLADSYR